MNKLSWYEVSNVAQELANKIRKSMFSPDCLVGVARGGLCPLAWLAQYLDINEAFTVVAGKASTGEDEVVSIKYLPRENLRGKCVLVVEDIA